MNRAAIAFTRPLVLATILLAISAPASALDALLLEFGMSESDEDVERYGGAARWNFGGKWLQTGNWHLAAFFELSVTYWDGKPGRTSEDDLVDFGLTNVLRYQRDPAHGLAPFVELGLGAHVHTEDGIGNKDFDIPFSFGSQFGAGARFGDKGKYELVYRFQHLSNASLGDSNPGINFHAIQLGYHF